MFLQLLFTVALHSSPTVDDIRRQADAMLPLVKTQIATEWLKGAAQLPDPTPRTLYRGTSWLTPAQYEALAPEEKAKVKTVKADATLYYNTKYGTPIAYARAVDLAAQHGLKTLSGIKLMDFGYGGIGQLRLFAIQGAEAVGVDVDPFLPALYSLPEDTGSFEKGSVKLVDGRYPAEEKTREAVGDGYTLIVSKNTLKRGYIHPERPADKRMLIDLGVSDEAFLASVHDALKPGGMLVIYNLCPAPAPPEKPYVPWADGRSPFTKEQYRHAGLKVVAFDVNDDGPIRKVAHAVGWDQGDQPMDTKKDLFAWYTIVRRENR
ncbi:MAG TPA: hypothetical protein VG944_01815 [Fimbriimonas sp.]|nr:hypothetical protein [Fimbriimonas sp.]